MENQSDNKYFLQGVKAILLMLVIIAFLGFIDYINKPQQSAFPYCATGETINVCFKDASLREQYMQGNASISWSNK